MKETIAGIILLILFVSILGFFFSGTVQPDLRGDGGYEPTGGNGHLLWNN